MTNNTFVAEQTTTKNWPSKGLTATVFCLLWVLFWYWDTAWAMGKFVANSDTFAHALVVPPIAIWLIWRARAQLSNHSATPFWWGLIAITALGFSWLLGELAAVNALTQFSLVATLILIVPTVLGLSIARAIAFPLFFVIFSVPIGDFLLPTLMEWTANFTVIALRLSGIPVYREGLQFVIPSGYWSVVEACSGIRYLIASITVGTLFAYLNYHSLNRRLLFILVSILVPVIANWVRAYLIVLLGHFSDNKLATGADHLIYGWVFFGLVIFLMFVIGARWSEPELIAVASPSETTENQQPKTKLWLIAFVVAVITAAFPLAENALQRSNSQNPVAFSTPLSLSSPWQQVPPTTDFSPAFENPSATLNETFSDGKQTVGVFIGYYRNQNYQRKLISSTNVLVRTKDSTWAQTSQGQSEVGIGTQNIKVITAELRNLSSDQQRLDVWQWYWVNGQLTSSAHLAKFNTAISRLLGKGDESAVIILYTPKTSDIDSQKVLQAFVAVNAENIAKILTHIQESR